MKYQFRLESIIGFGKYQGHKLEDIIKDKTAYITWCLENIPDFELNDEAYKLYEEYLNNE